MVVESMAKTTTFVEDDLAELGENLRRAELLGDVVVLGDVLAPDFRGIGPRGFILTKEDWLAKHRTGDLKYEAFERSEMTVRTYGDAAIMTSRESTKAFYKGREVPGGDYRATHVFVRQRGRWRLAGVQLSPILPGI
ncbi:MAG: nuclear transport factor 2 family protein [Methanobacteriota archaeon]|nr:MAG: nuclear transport factor 2 family protein [Euryarchaeota archaeon]TMA00201.1 MAG: nuclear transport factor 2 family protein [Euryarchaeota archaeon]